MKAFVSLMQKPEGNVNQELNIENRIAEDEKLRNLSKKLVNSKSNDRTTKREAKASER